MEVNFTKKDFIDAINGIKFFVDFEDKLNDLIRNYCTDGYIMFPDIIGTIICILERIFDDVENDWIGYYIWELKFGQKWRPGIITDQDGSDRKLETVEDLYDLLMENLRTNE